jgi:hypothetical protein
MNPAIAKKMDIPGECLGTGICGETCSYHQTPKLRKYTINEIYLAKGIDIDKVQTGALPLPDRIAFRLTTFYELMYRYEAGDKRITKKQYRKAIKKLKRFEDTLEKQKNPTRRAYLEEIDEIADKNGTRMKDLEVGPGTLGEKLIYLERRIREKEDQAEKYLKIAEGTSDTAISLGSAALTLGITDEPKFAVGVGLITFGSRVGKLLANKWYDARKRAIGKEYHKVILCKKELDDHRRDIRDNAWDDSVNTFQRYYPNLIETV